LKIIVPPAATARLCKKVPRPLVFVPTMGALHEGHVALIRRARRLAGPRGTVAASIFVNPAQFGPKEDLSRYPRPVARDKRLCRENGVDILFMPASAQMYRGDASTWVDESRLSRVLCGQSRPGHFRGVCTVVAKLFHIVAPDIAVFGEKDWQQLAIIRRMVRDLDMQVRIVGAPTVREADGLALSSRNAYLSPAERAQALVIRRTLLEARGKAHALTVAELRKLVRHRISAAPLAKIDYLEIVDADTLEPATHATPRKLIAAAVFFGRTRLIDNILL
jgi:pantoate--beta-alanine ligase